MASFSRKSGSAVSGTGIAAAVVLVVIVAAAAGYFVLVAPGTKPTTTTVISTVTSSTAVTTTATPTVSVILTGAGSTFIFPVISSMILQYQQTTPTSQINYQSIGSGGGISALEGKTVNFAASDAPLGAADQAKAPNVLTIPATIGAVTVAYNLPSVPTGLQLSGKVISDIFAGNVTTWNDPEIQSLNPSTTLPAHAVLVVHRSDGSGTTFTFTGYLSLVSASWAKAIGQAKTVAWPVGLGANGNAGVAGVVQGTQYTIGYVELAYALANKMTVGAVQNSAGNYVLPTLDSSAAAAASLGSLPAGIQSWASVNLLNEPGANSYPIVTFSYVLVYQELSVENGITQAQAKALVNFLWYVVHGGQQLASSQSYVPLPSNVVTIDEASIKSMTMNGQPLLSG